MSFKDPDKQREYWRQYRRRRRALGLERDERKPLTAEQRERKRVQERERHHAQPERARAHQKVRTALRNGTLVKPMKCSIDDHSCKGRIEAHHPDYSKPLAVIWLCTSHHRRVSSET